MTALTRRRFLRTALPLGVATLSFARTAGACVNPDSESLRASLNYVGTAADPAAACAHCAFFTADPAGGNCGTCQMLSGPVDATGHCDSFSRPA